MKGANNDGIIPLTILDLFTKLENIKNKSVKNFFRLSYMEIYNE